LQEIPPEFLGETELPVDWVAILLVESWIISKNPLLSRVLIWVMIQKEVWSCSSNGGLFWMIPSIAQALIMFSLVSSIQHSEASLQSVLSSQARYLHLKSQDQILYMPLISLPQKFFDRGADTQQWHPLTQKSS
jgi:hypothetical protein